MLTYFLTGWMLGIVTAGAAAFFIYELIDLMAAFKRTPPTKDEWKVM